jgi:hypothetical protein
MYANIDKEIYTVFPKGFTKLILDYFLKEMEKQYKTSILGITKEDIKSYITGKNCKNIVLKLNKALYSLKESPRL